MPLNLPAVPEREVSALRCYLTYISALIAGVAVLTLIRRSGIDVTPFLTGMAVTVISTIVIWIFSISSGNSSIYDPYWVIAPPLLILVVKAAAGAGAWHPRQQLLMAGFILWSARYHLFYRWSGWKTGLIHEDWRYEEMRSAAVPYWLNSLLGMHLFPTMLVYMAFAPTARVITLQAAAQPGLSILDGLGLLGIMAAVVIQLVSDEQMRRYRLTDDHRDGRSCREGLWSWSRHPNYFGEVLFWISTIPFAAAAGQLAERPVAVLAGPLAMAVFFRFSAFLMDRRSLARRTDYESVMKDISAVIPRPPRKSGNAVESPGTADQAPGEG